MAKVMRRVGTSDVDQSGKVRYWTGKSVTPNDTDLTLGATASGVVAIPMAVAVYSNNVLGTGQTLGPVILFDKYVTPGSTTRYGNPSVNPRYRWDDRPFLFRYFVGWRFNITPPAGTTLLTSRGTITVTTEQRTSRTKVFPPIEGTEPDPFPTLVSFPSSADRHTIGTQLMTYFWSDVDPG